MNPTLRTERIRDLEQMRAFLGGDKLVNLEVADRDAAQALPRRTFPAARPAATSATSARTGRRRAPEGPAGRTAWAPARGSRSPRRPGWPEGDPRHQCNVVDELNQSQHMRAVLNISRHFLVHILEAPDAVAPRATDLDASQGDGLPVNDSFAPSTGPEVPRMIPLTLIAELDKTAGRTGPGHITSRRKNQPDDARCWCVPAQTGAWRRVLRQQRLAGNLLMLTAPSLATTSRLARPPRLRSGRVSDRAPGCGTKAVDLASGGTKRSTPGSSPWGRRTVSTAGLCSY